MADGGSATGVGFQCKRHWRRQPFDETTHGSSWGRYCWSGRHARHAGYNQSWHRLAVAVGLGGRPDARWTPRSGLRHQRLHAAGDECTTLVETLDSSGQVIDRTYGRGQPGPLNRAPVVPLKQPARATESASPLSLEGRRLGCRAAPGRRHRVDKATRSNNIDAVSIRMHSRCDAECAQRVLPARGRRMTERAAHAVARCCPGSCPPVASRPADLP